MFIASAHMAHIFSANLCSKQFANQFVISKQNCLALVNNFFFSFLGGEELCEKCTTPAVKYGGGWILIWACIGASSSYATGREDLIQLNPNKLWKQISHLTMETGRLSKSLTVPWNKHSYWTALEEPLFQSRFKAAAEIPVNKSWKTWACRS